MYQNYGYLPTVEGKTEYNRYTKKRKKGGERDAAAIEEEAATEEETNTQKEQICRSFVPRRRALSGKMGGP